MLTLSCEKGKKVENKNCEHFLDYFFTSGMLQNVAYSITTLEVGVSPSKQDFFLLRQHKAVTIVIKSRAPFRNFSVILLLYLVQKSFLSARKQSNVES